MENLTTSEIAEEHAIAHTQRLLVGAMQQAQLSRAALSRRLGVSRAAVTSMLRDGKTMTIRSLARYLHACGYELCITTTPPLHPTSKSMEEAQ